MGQSRAEFRLELIGSFRLVATSGGRITITAKRSKALLAMLALARSGERSRIWLQEHLWGSRSPAQAQASLRRELSNLRPLVNIGARPVLRTDHTAVSLDLDLIDVDARGPDHLLDARGDLLEGIDIPGEEAFEDWLREERQALFKAREAGIARAGDDALANLPPGVAGKPRLSVTVEAQALALEEAAIVEGIAESLCEGVARLRWLPLIGAPRGLRGEDPDAVERTGRLLGVDYLLQCRMSRTRGFALALAEVASGKVLWSKSYDLSRPVATGELEEIATDAVAALVMQIETDQERKVHDVGVHQLSADELVWRARWHMRRLTREDASAAEELLARAAAARPGSAEIMVEQAYAEAWRLWALGAPAARIETLRRKVVLARDIDPYDARAHLLLGILDLWLRRHESAASLMREAIALNPSLSAAYGQLGSCHSLAGDPKHGIPLLKTALRLSPLDTQNFHQFGELALAQLMLGNAREAIVFADGALARRPAYIYGHVLKVASLIEVGDLEGGSAAFAKLHAIKPAFDVDRLDWLPFRDGKWNRKLKAAVIKAGAVEQPKAPVTA